jgi:hypothetical protein
MEILGFVLPAALTAGWGPYVAAGVAGMAFLEVLARATPNETDNKVVAFLGKIIASLNIRSK